MFAHSFVDMFVPGAVRGQKRVLEPLGLKLKMVGTAVWVLEIEPRSSTRATRIQLLTRLSRP